MLRKLIQWIIKMLTTKKLAITEDIFTWEQYCFDREESDITEIVIHATGGGGTLQYVKSGGRKDQYVKGIALFHFLIQKNVENIVQCLHLNKWTYHSSSGKHDSKTIGIEVEKFSSTNSGEPTESQYTSLIQLIEHLLDTYPNIQTICTHDYNRKTYSNLDPKPCPSDFDWARMKEKIRGGLEWNIC